MLTEVFCAEKPFERFQKWQNFKLCGETAPKCPAAQSVIYRCPFITTCTILFMSSLIGLNSNFFFHWFVISSDTKAAKAELRGWEAVIHSIPAAPGNHARTFSTNNNPMPRQIFSLGAKCLVFPFSFGSFKRRLEGFLYPSFQQTAPLWTLVLRRL